MTVRRPARLQRAAIACAALFAVLSTRAAAQQISVRVTEEGIAAQGVLIVLLDAAGEVQARGLSAADGRLLLRAAPGRYRVRAELIGRRATETDFFDIAEGQSLERLIALETQPVLLDEITAEGAQRCEVRPMPGRDVHTVWEEARKALESEQLGRETEQYRFDIERFVREVDPRNDRVVADQRTAQTDLASNPFRSLPAAELAESGYFRSDGESGVLYAPAPDVLLSDEFLDTHCFRLVRDERNRPGEIGLGFEPVSGRRQTDVNGVLWLDDSTAHLRQLEFRYVQLPSRLPGAGHSGEARFRRLPSGVWIVQQWVIRSPIVALQVGARAFGEERVVAMQEEGAEVTSIEAVDGNVIDDAARATLVGVVHHGREGQPLADATIHVVGSAYTATTDARGRFRIAGVPQGEYGVTFTHPRLEGSGYEPETRAVKLVVGETTEISFLLPRTAELTPTAEEAARADSVARVARALGSSRHDERAVAQQRTAGDPGRIHGRVLDHETGRAIEGVQVSVRGTQVTAISNARGVFTLAAVPPGEQVLAAEHIGYGDREQTVAVGAGDVLDIELRLATRPIELPPIAVETRSRWLAVQGYYDRRDGGLSGRFITRADIAERSEPELSRLLSDVPGARIHFLGAGKRHLRFNRQATDGLSSALSVGGLDGCEPQIYLDGIRYNGTSASAIPGVRVDDIDFLATVEIEAIEVYVGNPPPQYSHPCGVVLVWTRRGG
jgi:hypothetical protein